MVNNVEVVSLVVNTISPSSNEVDVNVNSKISIGFNSDIDTSTIVGNFVVLKDSNLNYINESSLQHIGMYEHVEGNLSYENKTIIFSPVEQFSENTRYIVSMRSSIKDILGRAMNSTYTSTFYTESIASLPKVEIISPEFGVVTDTVPKIEWIPQESSSAYVVQVSKSKTFEVLAYEEILKANELGSIDTKVDISQLDFSDGLYYIRVKSIGGEWSEESQFFIKRSKHDNAVVSKEDLPEDIVFDEDYNDELIVLDFFPKESETTVSEKVNIFYIKVMGKIEIEDIDFNETFAVGDLFDQEDEDVVSPHGYLDGKWNVVYDSDKHESYIVFVPIKL